MDSYQVPQEHYRTSRYNRRGRFISYWHQIDEILRTEATRILEIGVGNGLVSSYLRRLGLIVSTVDFDERLSPDIVADVRSLPVATAEYETVACFQLLEHLPYSDFAPALTELGRVSSRHVLISLPDFNLHYRVYLKIPRIYTWDRLYTIPRIRRVTHKFDGQHYWEIGYKDYPLSRIIGTISTAGLVVRRHFRVPEHPYHHFFVLTKRS